MLRMPEMKNLCLHMASIEKLHSIVFLSHRIGSTSQHELFVFLSILFSPVSLGICFDYHISPIIIILIIDAFRHFLTNSTLGVS